MINKKSYNVIIQTAFLGDLFLSIPLLQKIRSEFPQDELILVCKKGLGDYFLKQNLVDHIFEIKKGDRKSYQEIIIQLNQRTIQNLFCVHRSLRSQLMSLQIKAKNKIGFKSITGFFIFDKLVSFERTWPEPLRQLKLLTPLSADLNISLAEKKWSDLNQATESGQLQNIPKLFDNKILNQNKPLKRIAIFPGSVWATKKWTLQGFSEVALAFTDLSYEVYLMGGSDEKNLCLEIQKIAGKSIVLAGSKSISESVEFIKTCALVISNDSAPTHMAASQNIPVVTIFGPTTLELGFRPWSSTAWIIQNNNLNCRPCGKHGHQQCPLGHHRCMIDIKSKTVFDAAVNLIKSVSP